MWLLIFFLCFINSFTLLHQISRSTFPLELDGQRSRYVIGGKEKTGLGQNNWLHWFSNIVADTEGDSDDINRSTSQEIHNEGAGLHQQSGDANAKTPQSHNYGRNLRSRGKPQGSQIHVATTGLPSRSSYPRGRGSLTPLPNASCLTIRCCSRGTGAVARRARIRQAVTTKCSRARWRIKKSKTPKSKKRYKLTKVAGENSTLYPEISGITDT